MAMGYGSEGQMAAREQSEGKVAVCTARDCRWNDNTLCVARDGIVVNFHRDHADCNTYTQNTHIPGQDDSSDI